LIRFCIATEVETGIKEVFSKFDLALFKKLQPPVFQLKVNRFDGCLEGDKIELDISVLGISQKWLGIVTQFSQSEEMIQFTDEGLELPGVLKKWEHKHRISKLGKGSLISDDISYSTGNFILDRLIYPFLYLQFYYRKKIYKEYFRI
jgi:ligand-binding SRPBCC domain-containing protein